MKIVLAYKKVALSREKIVRKYFKLRERYETYICCKDEMFLRNFFSIMIMENYNRPWYLRGLEYFVFIIRKIINKEAIMTLGIMQVKTNALIGNIKSIRLAEELIQEEISKHHFCNVEKMIDYIAQAYNPSQLYREEIFRIYNCIASVRNNQGK